MTTTNKADKSTQSDKCAQSDKSAQSNDPKDYDESKSIYNSNVRGHFDHSVEKLKASKKFALNNFVTAVHALRILYTYYFSCRKEDKFIQQLTDIKDKIDAKPTNKELTQDGWTKECFIGFNKAVGAFRKIWKDVMHTDVDVEGLESDSSPATTRPEDQKTKATNKAKKPTKALLAEVKYADECKIESSANSNKKRDMRKRNVTTESSSNRMMRPSGEKAAPPMAAERKRTRSDNYTSGSDSSVDEPPRCSKQQRRSVVAM